MSAWVLTENKMRLPLSPPEGSCLSHSHQPSWSASTRYSWPAMASAPTQQYTCGEGCEITCTAGWMHTHIHTHTHTHTHTAASPDQRVTRIPVLSQILRQSSYISPQTPLLSLHSPPAVCPMMGRAHLFHLCTVLFGNRLRSIQSDFLQYPLSCSPVVTGRPGNRMRTEYQPHLWNIIHHFPPLPPSLSLSHTHTPLVTHK